MISLPVNTIVVNKWKLKTGIPLLAYVFIWGYALRSFMPLTSLSFVLALWTLPFTVHRQEQRRPSAVWMFLAVLFIVFTFLVPVKTFLYFSIGWAFLLLLPVFSYRPTFLSAAVLVVACPAFQYVTHVFSFPIRLKLTGWAGQMLALWFKGITTKGNVIYYGSSEFSVDPACMGLNMLVTSLLLGIMTLGYFQLKQGKRVGWGWALLFLAAVLGCNVVSNLLRIMLLVQFSIWPGTLQHELTGLACLTLYVLLPSMLLAKLAVRHLGVACQKGVKTNTPTVSRLLLHYLLVAAIALSAWRVMRVDTYASFQGAATGKVAGYRTTPFAPAILKLENDRALIYVKYTRGFYDTDHNPTLCWKGSGYTFQQVEKKTIGGTSVYTATLVNGPVKLYTAWWYGNGQNNTADQLQWRYDRLMGASNYAVINVTTADPESLHTEVEKVIRQKVLNPLFTKKSNP